jgi:hypothetical protein
LLILSLLVRSPEPAKLLHARPALRLPNSFQKEKANYHIRSPQSERPRAARQDPFDIDLPAHADEVRSEPFFFLYHRANKSPRKNHLTTPQKTKQAKLPKKSAEKSAVKRGEE